MRFKSDFKCLESKPPKWRAFTLPPGSDTSTGSTSTSLASQPRQNKGSAVPQPQPRRPGSRAPKRPRILSCPEIKQEKFTTGFRACRATLAVMAAPSVNLMWQTGYLSPGKRI